MKGLETISEFLTHVDNVKEEIEKSQSEFKMV